MKSPINFSKLDEVLKSIDASKSDVPIPLNKNESSSNSQDPFKPTTKEVDPKDIGRGLGDIIMHEGKQFVLYIKTPYEDYKSLLEIPAGKTRFHLVFCQTLENMQRENLFERYVVTNETHGNFNIHPYDHILKKHGDEIQARLGPCKHCLMHLNYEYYRTSNSAERNKIFKNFSLEEFFKKYETQIPMPKRSQLSLPKEGYSKNWREISSRRRQNSNWQCTCCGASFHENRRLHHTHHKDGRKENVIGSNLEELCAYCHSKRHQGMKIALSDKRAIEKIRQAQGFAKTCPNCP